MASPNFNAKFDCDTWDEKDITPLEGSTTKITRTRTERTFTGALDGKSVTEYTFVYHAVPNAAAPAAKAGGDADAKEAHEGKPGQMVTYNGLMYFKGKAEGYDSEGELVFTCTGTWGKGGEMKAIGDWVVIPGSGTGGLAGVKEGSGGYVSTGKTDQPCWVNLA
ncbi:hypothetical protein M408DRAFT_29192 [Serendipita vermifera MAFF 305830]|uniref:Uncharacterized protein n=1 Tax=Serendipita vermifera MAFF 305830 TaxID=933852 RepID=A0A0C2W5Z3_SERVB|nr:hypothetical protein M408DRAFT_29192 [Serendipita vermifera MAFF 305830]